MGMTTFAERFSQGTSGAVALAMIAFSVVFLVLMGLTLVIYAVRFIAAGNKKEQPAGKGGGAAKTATSAPSAPVAPKVAQVAAKDEEIAAVIAAAIAASCGGVVTSIRRAAPVGTGRMKAAKAWKLAARMELSEGLE